MEGVQAGFADLAGQDTTVIEASVKAWLNDPLRCRGLRALANPYGDGKASFRIMSELIGSPQEEFDG
jgi:UDP-N-acetylglucosamine 2-epimerase (non-hydrolysing)